MAIKEFIDYFLLAIVTWLALLSIVLIKTILDWRKLTKSGKNIDLGRILDHLNETQSQSSKNVTTLYQDLKVTEQRNRINFQKFALVRFNPFEDTGGDQSFAVALLDGENNGIVISSLHSRSSTRVYAKEVKSGKSSLHQFSKEEKEAVEKAISLKH